MVRQLVVDHHISFLGLIRSHSHVAIFKGTFLLIICAELTFFFMWLGGTI